MLPHSENVTVFAQGKCHPLETSSPDLQPQPSLLFLFAQLFIGYFPILRMKDLMGPIEKLFYFHLSPQKSYKKLLRFS